MPVKKSKSTKKKVQEKQEVKFDLYKFIEDNKRDIKHLTHKRYTTLTELELIKKKLLIYYKEYEEVKDYFRKINISYYFVTSGFNDKQFTTNRFSGSARRFL